MDKSLSLFMFILLLPFAACKAKEACMGEPKPDTICTMIYDPVCGCDGKTYSNSCVAGAAGVLKWTKGECK